MGDVRGFLEVERKTSGYRPVSERVKDHKDVTVPLSDEDSRKQASRCMDCGTPFCHWGCPVGNYIPEWNDLMWRGQWGKAFQLLSAANNFPEITGRVCPAICEYACVLGINDDPVTVKENELALVEYAFSNGLIKPCPPEARTGKTVAVIGSGPAGLACADELNKAGHQVTVFEKDDKPGGILRYGIPDFKLEKWVIDRRVEIMKEEGIKFITLVEVGKDYETKKLIEQYDSICLTGGSRVPRDIKIEGRDLRGIHFAMDYLTQENRRVSGETMEKGKIITASGKKVVVIGGGDTGSDCVGMANRQRAHRIVQIEVLPKPAEERTEQCPWPAYPHIFKTTSSHEEGCERKWSVLTKKFIGENGKIKKLSCVKIEFENVPGNKRPVMKEISGSTFEIEADLILFAVGFVHPQHQGLLKDAGVALDDQGNVEVDADFMTSVDKVFSAGDMRNGQSLVVRAIADGRCAARKIDKYLNSPVENSEGANA
ncbi:MAG: glutamate synthase subunit beta [Candidatus Omnitrophica bacterium]|nr:glutamate synthase subunit beta [Candidatus Omnitrophota bacterium]MBU1128534.1 glutamate synthase subunit beta [Candidatus Omnitrophota bacterium]MBU1851337.1 glutamate synthase subunit beta [Candidatus Omnitrophota bacterium]